MPPPAQHNASLKRVLLFENSIHEYCIHMNYNPLSLHSISFWVTSTTPSQIYRWTHDLILIYTNSSFLSLAHITPSSTRKASPERGGFQVSSVLFLQVLEDLDTDLGKIKLEMILKPRSWTLARITLEVFEAAEREGGAIGSPTQLLKPINHNNYRCGKISPVVKQTLLSWT